MGSGALSPPNSASRVSLSLRGAVGLRAGLPGSQPELDSSGACRQQCIWAEDPGWSWKEPVLGVWTDPQCLPCLPPLLSLLLPPPSRSHLNCCHGLLPCVPSEIRVPSLHSGLLQTGLLQLPCQSHLSISLWDLSQCANVPLLCPSVHLPAPAVSLWKENSMKAGGGERLRYAPANPGR